MAGDVAAKLPGLTALTVDSSFIDGDGCTLGDQHRRRRGGLGSRCQRRPLSLNAPAEFSPFAGLEAGDVLRFTSQYTISDGFGGFGSNIFVVEIFGSS